MIQVLEPCCIDHQFNQLLEQMQKDKKEVSNCIGYGDWDAARLLEVSIPRCAGGFVGISTGKPSVDFISKIRRLLSATINGASDRPNIFEMVWLMPPLEEPLRKEILTQLGKFIRTRQLTICEDHVGMRCYLCYGTRYKFVISGNMYMNKCSGVLQHYVVLTNPDEAANVMGLFRTQAKVRPSFRILRKTDSKAKKNTEVQKDCTLNVKEDGKNG